LVDVPVLVHWRSDGGTVHTINHTRGRPAAEIVVEVHKESFNIMLILFKCVLKGVIAANLGAVGKDAAERRESPLRTAAPLYK